MPASSSRPALSRSLAANVLPAYLVPCATSLSSALMRGDDRLAEASYSTIAGPSALAAAVVTLWFWVRSSRSPARPSSVARALVLAAVLCGGVALAVCGAVVASGLDDTQLLVDAAPSAAIGGGLAAAFGTRARNRRLRERRDAGDPADPSGWTHPGQRSSETRPAEVV